MPLFLMVKSVSDGSISIRWSEPDSDGGSQISAYMIEYLKVVTNFSDSPLDLEWHHYDTVDRFTTECDLTNLEVGGMYSVRVAAKNYLGLGKFAEISEPVVAKNLFCKFFFYECMAFRIKILERYSKKNFSRQTGASFSTNYHFEYNC
jgi:hypothetical protein